MSSCFSIDDSGLVCVSPKQQGPAIRIQEALNEAIAGLSPLCCFIFRISFARAGNKQAFELAQYHPQNLCPKNKKQIDSAAKEDRIRPREGMRLLNFYKDTLEKSMYLAFD